MPLIFYDQLYENVREATCNLYAQADAYSHWVYSLVGLGGFYEQYKDHPGFFYRQLCDRPPPPGPQPDFEGGQCPVRYGVAVRYVSPSGSESAIVLPSTNSLTGPIKRIYNFRENNETQLRGDDAIANGVVVARGSSFEVREIKLQYLYRYDGQPDNCGSLPPVPPPKLPPGSDRLPIDITYDGPDGPETYNLNLRIYAPRINISNNVGVDIGIDVGGIQLNGSIDVGGIDINVGGPGRDGDDGERGDPRDPGGDPGRWPGNYTPQPDITKPLPEPKPTDPRGDDETPPPPPKKPGTESILRAALVEVSKIGGKPTILLQTDNPNLLVPRLGYVQFFCRAGTEGFLAGWTEEIPIKSVRQLVTCPWDGGAIRVGGTPEPGVEWNITPIFLVQEKVIESITEEPV